MPSIMSARSYERGATTVAHRLSIDVVPIMRTSNREGLIDPGVKGIPLELEHPGHDLDGMSHERAGPL